VPRAPSLISDPRPSRTTRKSYGPRVPDRTMVDNRTTTFSFAGFRTNWLRREEAMKTPGRENPTRWAAVPSDRDFGAAGQNRSRSIKWAAKQEKLQPKEMCFFLTSPFIELLRHNRALGTTTPELASNVARFSGHSIYAIVSRVHTGRTPIDRGWRFTPHNLFRKSFLFDPGCTSVPPSHPSKFRPMSHSQGPFLLGTVPYQCEDN
jgi:hypothetical protein